MHRLYVETTKSIKVYHINHIFIVLGFRFDRETLAESKVFSDSDGK